MTPPRRVAPGSVCLVTAQAVARMHRFVPKPRIVRMLNYCLRLAATKFEGQIRLHEFFFMSNHAHLLLTDVAGVLPAFMQWLDSLIARNLNAIRGITGKNFEGYSSQIIEPDDAERQLDAAVYILNNACAAHLVNRSRHWKGTSSLRLPYNQANEAKRPADGIYKGTLTHLRGRASSRSRRASYARTRSAPTASVTLHPLPGFSERGTSDAELRRRVLERLDGAERNLIAARRRRGTAVLGWRSVVAKRWNDVPSSSRELFDVNPRVAASNPTFRERAEVRIREFRSEYRAALRAFISGATETVFPYGTWLMAQRYGLPCRPAAP